MCYDAVVWGSVDDSGIAGAGCVKSRSLRRGGDARVMNSIIVGILSEA